SADEARIRQQHEAQPLQTTTVSGTAPAAAAKCICHELYDGQRCWDHADGRSFSADERRAAARQRQKQTMSAGFESTPAECCCHGNGTGPIRQRIEKSG
uniref:DUF4124 domain-containing protein n=1 Tax=Macrostomum lignano TaxID=282301 RepID=A0A1I8GIT6_9PLAT